MADYSITAASVVPGAGAEILVGTAGATITRGQAIYKDSTDSNKLKLADCNSGTAGVRSPVGIALADVADGQLLHYVTKGLLTFGATLTAGVLVILSATAGGMAPVTDATTGWYTCIMGVPTSTTVLYVLIYQGGLAHA